MFEAADPREQARDSKRCGGPHGAEANHASRSGEGPSTRPAAPVRDAPSRAFLRHPCPGCVWPHRSPTRERGRDRGTAPGYSLVEPTATTSLARTSERAAPSGITRRQRHRGGTTRSSWATTRPCCWVKRGGTASPIMLERSCGPSVPERLPTRSWAGSSGGAHTPACSGHGSPRGERFGRWRGDRWPS